MVFEKITRTYLFQIALIISSVLVRDIHLIVHLIPSKFTFLQSVSTFRKFYGPHRLNPRRMIECLISIFKNRFR